MKSIFFYYLLPIQIFFNTLLFGQNNDQNYVALFESAEHIDPSKENLDSHQKDSSKKLQKNESPHKVTGGITFVSDYRSRGLSQTMCRPAVQGELTYTHQSGLYVKNWASNVSGASSFLNNASMEWDLYLGFAHKIVNSDISYDVGLEYYYYPGARILSRKQLLYDSLEYYIAFSYKGFNIRLSQTLTDFFAVNSCAPPKNWKNNRIVRPNGHSYHSPYLEMNYVWSPASKTTVSFHVGYQGVTNYPELNYYDWQIALAYQFDLFDFNLAYIDTSANRDYYTLPDSSFNPRKIYIGRATVIAGVSKGF